jgi:hypothetical protein
MGQRNNSQTVRMAIEYEGFFMKVYFIFVCLLITGGFASATTQTTLNQDKPSRLYMKQYNLGIHVYTVYVYPIYIYSENQWINETSSQSLIQTLNYHDGSSGSYFAKQSSAPATGFLTETMFWSNSMWPFVTGTEIYYDSTAFTSTTNSITSVPITTEYKDVSYLTSFYFTDNDGPNSVVDTRRATIVSVMHLQTGGKATSRLKKMFGISASAVLLTGAVTNGYFEDGDFEVSLDPDGIGDINLGNIASQNIRIGSYGNLNSNGILYRALSDNIDVDVTPYVKGADDYSFNITPYEVKSKADWQNVVQYEIDKDSGVAIESYNPAAGFMANRANLQAVYAFYQKLYTENGNLYWAGLGKLAGAPVYGGLSDAQWAIQLTGIDLTAFQNTLVHMNSLILQDLAWQSEAYYQCGLNALEIAYGLDTNVVDINTWRLIDQGVQKNNSSTVQAGNLLLANREQSQVLQSDYNTLNGMGGGISIYMSVLAKNPVPTGTNFSTLFPSGNLCVFNNRWSWITNNAGGIWPSWVAATSSTRSGWVNVPLINRAASYALVSPVF